MIFYNPMAGLTLRVTWRKWGNRQGKLGNSSLKLHLSVGSGQCMQTEGRPR